MYNRRTGTGLCQQLGCRVDQMARKPTITVTGFGQASGSPDQCRIHISLNHMAETASSALEVTADLATKAIASLAEIQAEECDVQTMGLSVQDFFDQAQQKVTARIGTYQLQVIVRPIDRPELSSVRCRRLWEMHSRFEGST